MSERKFAKQGPKWHRDGIELDDMPDIGPPPREPNGHLHCIYSHFRFRVGTP